MAQISSQPPHDTDYDSPWKEILERYFKEFMAFFFPLAYAGIEWSKPYEFLDKELQQIVRDAELGRRLVDKLVKVFTTEGEEAWVVVHVEIQGQEEQEFAQRMYVYNYRLFDRYHRRVISLAVLADDRKTWRPNHFGYALWDFEVSMRFPISKLLDYVGREEELESSINPFAVVVLAYLKTRATRRHPEARLQWKLRLFKLLYERGYHKQDILELTRFLDWIMVLPEALETQFDEAIFQYEEEQRMKYVTSFERYGLKKGLEKGRQEGWIEKSREDIADVLRLRFERIPEALGAALTAIDDPDRLQQLFRQAVTVRSFEEFMIVLGGQAASA